MNRKPFAWHGRQVDVARRVVRRRGTEVRLARREWELLVYLARYPDHVLSYRQMLTKLWGAGRANDMDDLRGAVSRLRNTLEDNPAPPPPMVTAPGVGVRLKCGE